MVQKPKIQYIGQFYVHGSEARALEQQEVKTAKTSLPKAKLEAIEKIYVDPVALLGIAVAVVMLVVMVIGAYQLTEDWKDYEKMQDYVHDLKMKNADLIHAYQSGYDLEKIETAAQKQGMIPGSEAKTIVLHIEPPEQKAPELTWDQKLVRFWNELWV